MPRTNTGLLQKYVNYGRKKFHSTGPRAKCYKTFYGRNLRTFVINLSLCPWQAFLVYSNKHSSSLVRKYANYRHKKFLNIGPRTQCYKTFLRIFVISYNVFNWQAFVVYSNKHSSLVRKYVNYGQKSVITLAPGVTVINFFTAVSFIIS